MLGSCFTDNVGGCLVWRRIPYVSTHAARFTIRQVSHRHPDILYERPYTRDDLFQARRAVGNS